MIMRLHGCGLENNLNKSRICGRKYVQYPAIVSAGAIIKAITVVYEDEETRAIIMTLF